MTTTSLETPTRRRLWLAAIKPPMYSVAIVPISLGTAIAYAQTQLFDSRLFVTFLLAAIAIIAWLNLSNDVFDSETGIDKNKTHSVVNLTGNKALVFWVSNLFLSAGILGLGAIAWWQQDLSVLGLILLACALGYSYQGPPFRFGYRGWGEIICFFTFGPIAISAAYYSQAQQFSLAALLPATIVGVSTSIILFCSHFHQVEDDLAAGKRSPIVRLGTQRGAQLLPWLVGSIFAIAVAGMPLGLMPLWSIVMFASVPFAAELVAVVRENHACPEQVSHCKFIAVKLHFWSGMLLCLGFVLPIWL